jgi:phage terminase small subunit
MTTRDAWAETLTEAEERAVREYMVDGNAVGAYTRAGYGARSALKNASTYFNQPHIAAAIVQAQSERSARTGIDADWLLRRLAAEADADVADLYDADGFLKHPKDWPAIWRTGLVAGMDVMEEKRNDVITSRLVKVKLADRSKRLDMIGKHVNVQAFRERIDHGLTREAARMISASMSPKEAAEAYKEELERGD